MPASIGNATVIAKAARKLARSKAFRKFSHLIGFAVTSSAEMIRLHGLRDRYNLFIELSNLIQSKHVPFVVENTQNFKGQILQDLVCSVGFNNKRGGFFVEDGVGNGNSHSNSLSLESRMGWKGILIEPNPFFHKSICQERSSSLIKTAITNSPGVFQFLAVGKFPELSTLSEYKNVDSHGAYRVGKMLSVIGKPLEDILIEANSPMDIDYLSLDTEGSEFSILQKFDFSKFRVGFLTVEHNHTKVKEQRDTLMLSRNFLPILDNFSRWDRFYVNRRILGDFSANFRSGTLF